MAEVQLVFLRNLQMLNRVTLLIGFLSCFLTGCNFSTLRHDQNLAAAEASRFLSILYFQEDYVAAYKLLAKEFRRNQRPEFLKHLIIEMKQRFGDLKSLRAESFLPMPGQKS